MPLYVIEREFAERLELPQDVVRRIDDVNAEEGVSWLFSFITADRLHTYCLYEAPSPDAIVEAARRRAGGQDRRGQQVRAGRGAAGLSPARRRTLRPCPGTS